MGIMVHLTCSLYVKSSEPECLKAEKTMIYSYPLLPETQARDIILIRPPGNKYDS